MMKQFIKPLLCLSLVLPISAAEVDTFTNRHLPLEDSLVKVNRLVNDYLARSVSEFNSEKEEGKNSQDILDMKCDEEDLYKVMRKYFNNQYMGELGKALVEAEGFDKHPMTIEESIYADFKWYQSIVQGFFGRVLADPTASTVNVGGVLIGTDKFEHFFGSGFRYFDEYYFKDGSLQDALDIGENAESGILGAITTGVLAYADLSANFNGMRFWNHLLQKREDILGEDMGPYLSCQNGYYEIVKPIDMSSYIDHSFDESINCSAFTTEKMLSSVLSRIDALEKENEISLHCPVKGKEFKEAWDRYGELAPSLLNERGHYALRKRVREGKK